VSTQRLHDTIDSITGQAKNYINTPIDQALDEHVGRGHKSVASFRGL
jgi:hypothetical protein